MPVKQRHRIKRRTFAKLRIKRQREKSELIETIDGNPIFTTDDFEDDRITKLLQQRQSSNYDDDERDIFLTDLLDADSDNDEVDINDPNSEHRQMLEDIFGAQSIQEPTIMGSQLTADPLDIQTNASDLQYLMRSKRKQSSLNLSQQLDELENAEVQTERVTMDDMLQSLNVPIAKAAAKQINEFDDNQELQRLKLTAQTKITQLNLARKERGLQMDRTRKEMHSWSQAVSMKTEKLKHRRNLIPPRNNMTSFMDNMEWNGDLGKELQCILDDYTQEHDLDSALKRHKPSKQEVVKQSKKMAAMRRQIANQIKDFKRIKKIKSKAFRKRLRARKAKITPSLEELQEIDPKLYQREVKKLLRQRAQERVTLRHKNSSKWAMNIVRRGKDGKIDINSRRALMEQLERGKELKRKIKGIDSDEEDEEPFNQQKHSQNTSQTNSFETEVEAEEKKKEKQMKDAKDKGIWNMKFMKEAEDKRRADIQSLTDSATRAESFKELDDLDRSVQRIEKHAYHVHPLVNSEDDPIGASKHANWMRKQQRIKAEQIQKAQTILGKRKFGFSSMTNTMDMEPTNKKMKHRVLDLGGKAKIIDGTQRIEESVFGKGTKSIMRVDVEDEDKGGLVTNDSLRVKTQSEPIFEMVEFPRHNPHKKSISEINKEASKDVDWKEKKRMNSQHKPRIKHQRYYLHDVNQQSEGDKEENDGWSVVLDGNQSVHSVHFGTLAMNRDNDKVHEKKQKENEMKQADESKEVAANTEDLEAFLSESEESEDDVDQDIALNTTVETPPKSILKRSKYQSVSTTDKRIKWSNNEYSDGDPNTKYHSTKTQTQKASNPWLMQLNGNKKGSKKVNKEKARVCGQKETTKFNPNKLLIPQKLHKAPDFNLLETNDPKQIETIYKALNEKNKFAEFTPNDTAKQDFKKLKESVIEKSMPDDVPEPLKGWDHWTGYGIEEDASLRDCEYLEAKALYEKKKKKLLEQRSDGHLKHVILSGEISKASSKYVLKWQPDWVNLGMYRTKMNDTMGREWNLSTEFFNTIRPQHDIPNGYIIAPTQKEDGNDNYMNHKTSFGKKETIQKKPRLQSVYKGNVMNDVKTRKHIDSRPQRDRV